MHGASRVACLCPFAYLEREKSVIVDAKRCAQSRSLLVSTKRSVEKRLATLCSMALPGYYRRHAGPLSGREGNCGETQRWKQKFAEPWSTPLRDQVDPADSIASLWEFGTPKSVVILAGDRCTA
jgi:hypothetical protein